ncbi:MAG: hypothetical protein ACFFAO_12340 [Candidatus Hermodarchaeota archaeon]
MEEKDDTRELIANEIMNEIGLKGKPIMNKLLELIDLLGNDKNKVKDAYLQFKRKEDFANNIMIEEGLKGKSTRIKIMKIIDTMGWNKQKIKTGLLRSTIASRIEHQ